jgi:hypothetical protein
VWDSVPRQIAARFIRNGQIIHYLVDLHKASCGQQDITLFFYRMLQDEANEKFVKDFEDQVRNILAGVERVWVKRRAAEKEKKKREEEEEKEKMKKK